MRLRARRSEKFVAWNASKGQADRHVPQWRHSVESKRGTEAPSPRWIARLGQAFTQKSHWGEHALVVHAAILGEQDVNLDGPVAAIALARIHESARANSPVSTAKPR